MKIYSPKYRPGDVVGLKTSDTTFLLSTVKKCFYDLAFGWTYYLEESVNIKLTEDELIEIPVAKYTDFEI